jgi:hypothetical protein
LSSPSNRTCGQTVAVFTFAVAHDLELGQFDLGENGNGLGAVHPFVPNFVGRETD